MKLHELSSPDGARRRSRRIARGIGGKGGKTAGRGTKGQGARDTIKPGFEGGQLPLSQRVPKLKGFKNPFRVSYNVVSLDALAEAAEGGRVTPELLHTKGKVHAGGLVKVLGGGEVTVALEVEAHAFSASAKAAIEAAGGSTIVVPPPFGGGRPPAKGNALTNR